MTLHRPRPVSYWRHFGLGRGARFLLIYLILFTKHSLARAVLIPGQDEATPGYDAGRRIK